MSPCLLILLTIMSIVIMWSINHTSGGGILLAVAQQQQPTPSPAQDRIGGILGGGGRAQQVMQCFTGCGQEIVGCGVTCTLGSSQSIAPCFMDCGLSNFVCMNSCFQPSIPDVVAFIPGPTPQPAPMY
ncbi:hypothetical protein L1987_46640 [Smallanthus sonchifolius]|uniref:Uncharacterized protein n=1 Tax=Smallanthus sonchifolius TaxID=185202 RepID=A0ACB9G0E9_9ASTR|nr:hypothetical protein L1987_46640 [Smallanthus sonchifolius]